MGNMTPLYAGKGWALRKASVINVVESPENLVIPDGGYSEGFVGHDANDFAIEIICKGAATGDVLIEKGDDNGFTNVITYDTIPVNGFYTASWSHNSRAIGSFRIKNNSGQALTAFVQKYV